MIYIKFSVIDNKSVLTNKKNWGTKTLIKILEYIIPKANPDFETKIDLVSTWILEFEDYHNPPQREIGLDYDGNIIMKMPFKDNVGYWTDNNMTLDKFNERFKIEHIDLEQFNTLWNITIENI